MKVAPSALVVALALLAPASAAAASAAPSSPPRVLAAPSGTVNETTHVMFRIKAHAGDSKLGHWAVLIASGNDDAIALRQSHSRRSVYERTVRLHNDRIYAATRKDAVDSFNFSAPQVADRIFPGTVTWRVAFFPNKKRSHTGAAATRTPRRHFTFKATFANRRHVGEPSLPRAKSHAVVPLSSIGGVSLGVVRKRVLGLWGGPFVSDEQLFDRTDTWSMGSVAGDGSPSFSGDSAEVDYDQDVVVGVTLSRPDQGAGGLEAWKTSKGIGLGSTESALVKAYPDAQFEEDSDDPGGTYLLQGSKNELVIGLDKNHLVHVIALRRVV